MILLKMKEQTITYEKGRMMWIIIKNTQLIQSENVFIDGTFKAVKNNGNFYIVHSVIDSLCR